MSSRLDWARKRPYFKEQSKDQDQNSKMAQLVKATVTTPVTYIQFLGTHLVDRTDSCQSSSGLHRHAMAYTMAGTYTNKCNENKKLRTAEVWLPSTASVLTKNYLCKPKELLRILQLQSNQICSRD